MYSILSDNFIDRIIVGVRNLLGYTWERNISKLNYRIQYNKGIWCRLTDCFPYELTERIVSVYIHLAKEFIIPEYDRTKRNIIPTIENEVYNIVKGNINDVKVVLWEMYWATMDGTIIPEICFPLTYKNQVITMSKPELETAKANDAKNFFSELTSPITTTWSALSFILPAVVIGAGGIVLYRLYQMSEGIKRK